MTIEDLRGLIRSGGIVPDDKDSICTGTICDSNGNTKGYELYEGWDPIRADECDLKWGEFNFNLIKFISEQDYSKEELAKIQDYIQLDDDHWDWLKKSYCFRDSQYKFFFMYADGKPQAACIIYHPKESALGGRQIYYIEYLAAAPWNRKNPMRRDFTGIGKITLKSVHQYCDSLGWEAGFSLHALPKAEAFYTHIGMSHFENHDKQATDSITLKYFEMLEEPAKQFFGEI